MSTLPPTIQTSLKAYTTSPSFKIIHSIPSSLSLSPPTSTLLILDSSFNPPTKAHAYLLHQAISRLQKQHQHKPTPPNAHSRTKARILLLLSTKNADKPSAPAETLDRVCMMALFAQDLWDRTESTTTSTTDTRAETGAGTDADTDVSTSPSISGIDIGVSPQPRFLEKSVFLATSSAENPYSGALEFGGDVAQWHLLGFDTLVRLLDGKYYEGGELGVLRPLFEGGNRVFVVRRGGGEEMVGQEEFVRRLKVPGAFDGRGWEVEWGERVELVDGFGEEGVSSTAVRNAAREGREGVVGEMCARMVAEYVMANDLYKE